MADKVLLKKKLLLLMILRRRRRREKSDGRMQKKKKRFWVRDIFKKRMKLGDYHRLFLELKLSDREYFFR